MSIISTSNDLQPTSAGRFAEPCSVHKKKLGLKCVVKFKMTLEYNMPITSAFVTQRFISVFEAALCVCCSTWHKSCTNKCKTSSSIFSLSVVPLYFLLVFLNISFSILPETLMACPQTSTRHFLFSTKISPVSALSVCCSEF